MRPAPRGGTLLVGGTTSNAGKSVLTAGLCRLLRRHGLTVAPFKAQNMSNNSAVTADGAEIGRAQYAQAQAAGVTPEAAMNPVLLKPGSDRRSHVVLRGRPHGEAGALDYRDLTPVLREAVLDSFDDLRRRFDVVVCEGAGSVAEINLRGTDLANLGLASARAVPVIVVGDIDRGGVFGALYGCTALLSAADQALISGYVINQFRGDPRLLDPGLDMLRRLTGRDVLGVVPWTPGVGIDGEDSLDLDASSPCPRDGSAPGVLRVAAVRFPRTSNATDLDALACEPGVDVTWTTSPQVIADADLAVLPGTRATLDDLAWLHTTGLARAVVDRAAAGQPILGICGGYQMLARTIADPSAVESPSPCAVAGLGLLPADVRFDADKTLGRPCGPYAGHPVDTAYVIHHGRVRIDSGVTPFLDGARAGTVWGTTWHGAFESDGFRRAFLSEIADAAGSPWRPGPPVRFADVREARFDALADLLATHLDVDAVLRLIADGAPSPLPFLPPGAPPDAPATPATAEVTP